MPHATLQIWRLCLALALLGVGWTGAQEEVADAPPEETSVLVEEPEMKEDVESETDDSVVPQAFSEDRYLAMWNKNPFLLETAPIIQNVENFSKDWSLAGIIASGGVYKVTLRNKQTGTYQRLSEGDNSGEFRLISVNYDRDRTKSSVKVSRGSETADLTFDGELLAQPVTVSNTMAPTGDAAQPGQGGQVNANLPPGAQASLMQRGPNGQPLNQPLRPGMPGYVPGRAGTEPGAAANPNAPRVNQATGAPLPGASPGLPNPGMGAVPGAPGAVPSPGSRRRQLIPTPIQQK